MAESGLTRDWVLIKRSPANRPSNFYLFLPQNFAKFVVNFILLAKICQLSSYSLLSSESRVHLSRVSIYVSSSDALLLNCS